MVLLACKHQKSAFESMSVDVLVKHEYTVRKDMVL